MCRRHSTATIRTCGSTATLAEDAGGGKPKACTDPRLQKRGTVCGPVLRGVPATFLWAGSHVNGGLEMQRQNGPGAGRKAAAADESFTERAAGVLHEGVDAL